VANLIEQKTPVTIEVLNQIRLIKKNKTNAKAMLKQNNTK